MDAYLELEMFAATLIVQAVYVIIAWIEGIIELTEQHMQINSDIYNQGAAAAILAVAVRQRRQGEVMGKHVGRRRKRIKLAWESAHESIQRDYMGANAVFAGREFERMFRITKSMVEELIVVCGNADVYFTQQRDATGRLTINPVTKILCVIKSLAFGTSPVAFRDYFQMGERTMYNSMQRFCRIISTDRNLRNKYLRRMTAADARRVSAMHQEKHGIEGMLGSLDCVHIGWKNCPVAWQGQYLGMKGKPTMILEAAADHNLWVWHAAFSMPGAQNDINVWDQSKLLREFLDGSYTRELDFNFTIGGQQFNMLWFLVDGIYPELARFVKTISQPITDAERKFTKWQESCRKDIERVFGVIVRKFQILKRDIEKWDANDVTSIVFTCIVMHNMMVEHRVTRNEVENHNFYAILADSEGNNNNRANMDEQQAFQVYNYVNNLQQVHFARYGVDAVQQMYGMEAAPNKMLQLSQMQWNMLYNRGSHQLLQNAILQQLMNNVE